MFVSRECFFDNTLCSFLLSAFSVFASKTASASFFIVARGANQDAASQLRQE
jgi:hypothetical protein